MVDLKKLADLTVNIGDMALKRRVISIITELDIKDTDRILDCGCGDGLYLKTIRDLAGCHIMGFDTDMRSLGLVQGFLAQNPVPLTRGDIVKLPFKDNSFDKIFSTEVLEHVPNDLKAAQEIFRVLKPGGLAIITVPNHNYPFLWDPINWILEHLIGRHIKSGFWAGLWNMHLRLYYPGEIKTLLSKAGFKIELVKPLTHYCVPFNHIGLYGLKQVLNSGLLPEAISNSADKFKVKQAKQSKLVHFGYKFLSFIDKGNDRIADNTSSVAIFVKAKK